MRVFKDNIAFVSSCMIRDLSFQGGLKAVVWTDTIQTVMMFGAVIVVLVLGTNKVGGVAEVWKRNVDTERIEFFKYEQVSFFHILRIFIFISLPFPFYYNLKLQCRILQYSGES